MKTSNKSNIITGAVLLSLSAAFTISLILQLLNFGVGGPGHDNLFFLMGNILYTVYGFSSLWIPVFLLITGLSCFATKWTAKRTVRLLTAIVPFFTSVITENICRSILKLENSSFPVTKIVISLVIGSMLMFIEFLFAGIIADKANDSFYKITKQPRPAASPETSRKIKDDSRNDAPHDSEGEIPEKKSEQKIYSAPDAESEKMNSTEGKTEESPFDAALSTLKLSRPSVSEKVTKGMDEESEHSEKAETSEIEGKNVDESKTQENSFGNTDEDDEPVNPATILTQEEYAALIQPDAFSDDDSIPTNSVDSEELEWHGLPPAPATLPPEYDEDYGLENKTSETEEKPDHDIEDDLTTEDVSEKNAEADDDDDLEFPLKDEIAGQDEGISNESGNSENDDDTVIFSQEDDFSADFPDNKTGNENDENFDSFEDIDLDEENDGNFSMAENETYDVDFSKVYYDDFTQTDESDENSENPESEEFDRQFIQQANALENELLSDIEEKTRLNPETGDENDGTGSVSDSDFNPDSYDDANQDSATENDSEDDIEFESPEQFSSFYEDAGNDNNSDNEGMIFENPETGEKGLSSLAEEGENETESSGQNEKSVPSAPKYTDSVVDNPSYPYGIKIHSGKSMKKEPSPQKQDMPKPTYPTTITLADNKPQRKQNQDGEKNPSKNANQDSENMNNQVSPATANATANPAHQETAEKTRQSVIDPDFYDIDANETPEAAERHIQAKLRAEQIIRQRQKEMQQNGAMVQDQIHENRDTLKPMNDHAYSPENATEESQRNFSSHEQAQTLSLIPQDPFSGPSTEADDLTSDDLNAFFNAQEEENTPRTTEIQGTAPKTDNRAQAKRPYVIPSDLLTAYKDDQYWLIDEATKQSSINLTQTLSEFNIEAKIIGIKKGPVVTMFELLPAPGVKLSKIVALQDNIALSLAASSVRIVAPIPGKQAVGIEVPNKNRSIVGFREIIEMPLPEWDKMAVPVILGKDILGKPQLIDLVKTPHMLIAGATGSGKSVCVNSLILSILYKRSYKDVKLILVDPKVVELKLYNNIPHLLTPVITEPKKAFQALQYCLCEMERRYALLDGVGVRDISSYNQRIRERNICTEKLPYIVVIIDEFADLMATTGRELESVVARLTAMSRAVGIHLVLATQRPSVNVITGLIKANIPSRIAFMVASRTDSNIILDSVGAEKLLGRGDMLYTSAVDPYPIRIQGTFVSDQEVENVVGYVKEFGEPDYIDDEIFVDDDDDLNENVDLFGNSMDEDPLYDQALEIVVQAGKASASYIQRRLKIGYNRAARLVEEMEERGIVGPANGSKPREIIHMP